MAMRAYFPVRRGGRKGEVGAAIILNVCGELRSCSEGPVKPETAIYLGIPAIVRTTPLIYRSTSSGILPMYAALRTFQSRLRMCSQSTAP